MAVTMTPRETLVRTLATLRRRRLGTVVELPAAEGKRPRRRYEGLRPYDLRHTFASLLLAEGRSLHYVAEQLGHGAEQTARTYGHVIAEYRDRPAIDAEGEIRAARGVCQSAA